MEDQFSDASFSPPIHNNNNNWGASLTVVPNELPGYTGWARPEHTDAGHFRIVEPYPSEIALAGQEWVVTVECSSCRNESWFYLRAYGPAVITGTVQNESQGRYRMRFLPIDPGIYTIEAVLTFSAVPPVENFPLQDDVPEYEGYLLPGFPFFLTVQGDRPLLESKLPYCTLEQLTTDKSPLEYARWRLIDSIRNAQHTIAVPGNDIQLAGYQQSFQGLGLRFSYDRLDCRILGVPNAKSHNPMDDCLRSTPLHIILIGDSVMRLQYTVLKGWMKKWIESNQVKITFYELYGGTLRCERVSGPKLSTIPQEQSRPDERKIVLFNSGLHDIHRLCGDEWKQDRETYLNESELKQSCVHMYHVALETLVSNVLRIPHVDLFLFQTTTAGWPKYGNFGVAWDPTQGQGLPLDAAFVDRFNRIAVEYIIGQVVVVVGDSKDSNLYIMDGYWISLSRPDNREVNKNADLGKKLSHPGHEVVYAMVRFFVMMMTQTLCPSLLDKH